MNAAIQTIKIGNPNGVGYIQDNDGNDISFPVTNSSERQAELMGDDYVKIHCTLSTYVLIPAMSYIFYNNQSFFIKEDYYPTEKSGVYTYNMSFYSLGCLLDKFIFFRNINVTGVAGKDVQSFYTANLAKNYVQEYVSQAIAGKSGSDLDEAWLTAYTFLNKRLYGVQSNNDILMLKPYKTYSEFTIDDPLEQCTEQYNNEEQEFTINANLETMLEMVVNAIGAGTTALYGVRCADKAKSLFNTIYTTYHSHDTDTDKGVAFRKTLCMQDSAYKAFSFAGSTIKDALDTIIKAYTDDDIEVDWYIYPSYEDGVESYTLYFKRIEGTNTMFVSDVVYETGSKLIPYRTRGLLSCEKADKVDVIPHFILPYGSDRNMTSVYGVDGYSKMTCAYNKKLKLYPNTSYDVTDENGNSTSFITNDRGELVNEDATSYNEILIDFDDVYPRCYYQVVEVRPSEILDSDPTKYKYHIVARAIKSVDSSGVANALYTNVEMEQNGILPLSNSKNALAGETPQIVFESGKLNGMTFDAIIQSSYNASTTQVNAYDITMSLIERGVAAENMQEWLTNLATNTAAEACTMVYEEWQEIYDKSKTYAAMRLEVENWLQNVYDTTKSASTKAISKYALDNDLAYCNDLQDDRSWFGGMLMPMSLGKVEKWAKMFPDYDEDSGDNSFFTGSFTNTTSHGTYTVWCVKCCYRLKKAAEYAIDNQYYDKTYSQLKTEKESVDINGKSFVLQIVPNNSDDENISLPQGLFIPTGSSVAGEGDKFSLVNMQMPVGYVEMAREELAQKAYEYYLNTIKTKPAVNCVGDPVYFADKTIDLGSKMCIISYKFSDLVDSKMYSHPNYFGMKSYYDNLVPSSTSDVYGSTNVSINRTFNKITILSKLGTEFAGMYSMAARFWFVSNYQCKLQSGNEYLLKFTLSGVNMDLYSITRGSYKESSFVGIDENKLMTYIVSGGYKYYPDRNSSVSYYFDVSTMTNLYFTTWYRVENGAKAYRYGVGINKVTSDGNDLTGYLYTLNNSTFTKDTSITEVVNNGDYELSMDILLPSKYVITNNKDISRVKDSGKYFIANGKRYYMNGFRMFTAFDTYYSALSDDGDYLYTKHSLGDSDGVTEATKLKITNYATIKMTTGTWPSPYITIGGVDYDIEDYTDEDYGVYFEGVLYFGSYLEGDGDLNGARVYFLKDYDKLVAGDIAYTCVEDGDKISITAVSNTQGEVRVWMKGQGENMYLGLISKQIKDADNTMILSDISLRDSNDDSEWGQNDDDVEKAIGITSRVVSYSYKLSNPDNISFKTESVKCVSKTRGNSLDILSIKNSSKNK